MEDDDGKTNDGMYDVVDRSDETVQRIQNSSYAFDITPFKHCRTWTVDIGVKCVVWT